MPLLLLGLVTAAIAYTIGIAAIRRLGSRLASFVALTEVLAGVLWAWVLLDELPRTVQLLGGLLILVGVVGVKLGERTTVRPETDARLSELSRKFRPGLQHLRPPGRQSCMDVGVSRAPTRALATSSFDDWAEARAAALLRFAYLVTGSQHAAEDAVQSALDAGLPEVVRGCAEPTTPTPMCAG